MRHFHPRVKAVALLACFVCALGYAQRKESHVDWFIGIDSPLQNALDEDSVPKLRAALRAGARVNAKGKFAVTPLEYAVGHFGKQTYIELLRQHADPNQKDQEGDNAVTLAVRAYAKDPEYLVLALKSGGDPNTRKADDDPILASFIASHNVEAIKLLASLGADIDARGRDASPLVVDAALTEDWDVVWCLLELGAKYDYSSERHSVQSGFRNPRATPPDSPLYKYKAQSWRFLTAHGVALPPLQ